MLGFYLNKKCTDPIGDNREKGKITKKNRNFMSLSPVLLHVFQLVLENQS
jgi:hypothetical protein